MHESFSSKHSTGRYDHRDNLKIKMTRTQIPPESVACNLCLPERTGCTLSKSMEQANNGDKSTTALPTSSLSVNTYAKRPLRHKNNANVTHPMQSDVSVMVIIENFTLLELPLPSSFDTLTLQIFQENKQYVNSFQTKCVNPCLVQALR